MRRLTASSYRRKQAESRAARRVVPTLRAGWPEAVQVAPAFARGGVTEFIGEHVAGIGVFYRCEC